MAAAARGIPIGARGNFPVLCALSCALAILGAKIWLIRLYASPVPYGDQWVEAFDVYAPYLRGDLAVADWLRNHNEHRILFTRATAFAIYQAAGRWEPLIQMLFNAALHAATIGALIAAMSRTLTRASALSLALVATALIATPYAWENTLWGFQAQFYWLIALGTLCVWLMSASEAFTPRWIAGFVAGLLSYFAMASGAVTLLAAAAIATVQMIVGARRGRGALLGLLMMIVPALICVFDAFRIAQGHTPELAAVAVRFAIIAAWPMTAVALAPLLLAVALAVALAPLMVTLLCLLRERAPISDRRWLYAAIAVWTLAQMATIAFGRGDVPTASRYLDVFVLCAVANAACLFALVDRAPRGAPAAAAIWLTALALGAGKGADTLGTDLAARNALTTAQAASVLDHLRTGNQAGLRDVRLYPAPLAEPLIRTLSDPAVRRILPEAVSGVPETRALRLFKKNIMDAGPPLLALGFGLFVLTLLGVGRWPDSAQADPVDESRADHR